MNRAKVKWTSTTHVGTTGPSENVSTNVRVHTFGGDVPQDQVTEVRNLINKYHIMEKDAALTNLKLTKPVDIYIAKNQSDYEHALSRNGLSVSEAKNLSHDTGGFTLDNTIVIPLYQNGTAADMANTLSHEITHAFINDNAPNIPSWLNEGIAVYDGMTIQRDVQGQVPYDGYAKRMAETVLDAANTHQLLNLTDDENTVLYGKSSYDLEIQDWLGVSYLIHHDGIRAMQNYLSLTSRGEDNNAAFIDAFGESSKDYNTKLSLLLRTFANGQDNGVITAFSFPEDFSGEVRILQHGSLSWKGFIVEHGVQVHQYQISETGSIGTHGPDKRVAPSSDDGPPDNGTLYINIESTDVSRYAGQEVEDAGYAIDFHDGLYGFLNAWVTLKNGKSIYLRNAGLLGTRLMKVSEVNQDNPILTLIEPAP